ncbi:hypothetical protein CADE109221_16215 [Castellaniella denitrificans]
MDDVTRQNASLVEESAAAAASLREQADTLTHLVDTFRLAEAGAQPEPDRPRSQSRTGGAGQADDLPAYGPERVISAPPRVARPASPPAPRAGMSTGGRRSLAPPVDDGEWSEF